jgi:hypothetical protein
VQPAALAGYAATNGSYSGLTVGTALAGWPTQWSGGSITSAVANATTATVWTAEASKLSTNYNGAWLVGSGGSTNITGGGTWTLNAGTWTYAPTGITTAVQSALDGKLPTNGVAQSSLYATNAGTASAGTGLLDRQFAVLIDDLAFGTNSSVLADVPLGIFLTNGTWFIDGYLAMGQTTNAAGTKANLSFSGTVSSTNVFTHYVSTTELSLLNATFTTWGVPRNGNYNAFNFIQYPGRSMGVLRRGALVVTAPGTLSWQASQNTAISNHWTWIERGSYLKGERYQ